MKKSIIIFLSFFYFTAASGINVNLHYCGGKLASFKFSFGDRKHSCPCGNKKMKKNCCKDERLIFKLKQDQKKPVTLLPAAKTIKETINVCLIRGNLSCPFGNAFFIPVRSHAPPGSIEIPRYISNCVYRI